MTKKVREPLFHLVKRTDSNPKRAWLIRIAAFVFSVLLCAIVTVGVTGEGFVSSSNTSLRAFSVRACKCGTHCAKRQFSCSSHLRLLRASK